MKVLLQFPEGLKQYALKHAKELESKGDEVFISASPTYGACDLAIDEAKKLGAEKLVHFGHNEFHKVDFNVEYVPYTIDANIDLLANIKAELAPYKKVGIVTTVQQVHQIEDIKRSLEAMGKEVLIGKPYGFAKKQGQILGCDIGSAASINKDVDCFLYFGGGLFHPLGAVYATTKPFLAMDPFGNKWMWLDSYRELQAKHKKAIIMRSIFAKKFGILVSKKNGQHNLNLAKVLKSRLEKSGNEAAILIGDTFDFESLDNMMEFDAFVNTACPRLATDDTERLRKPLLSANEAMELMTIRAQK